MLLFSKNKQCALYALHDFECSDILVFNTFRIAAIEMVTEIWYQFAIHVHIILASVQRKWWYYREVWLNDVVIDLIMS